MSILTDRMFDFQLRAGDNLDVPVMAVPEVHGTPGTTSYTYCATFRTNVGETTPAAEVTVTTGPATLNGVNYIRLAVDAVPAAALAVRFYKWVVDAFYLLGEIDPDAEVLDDTGQAVQSDALVPVVNTSGRPNWRALLFNTGRPGQRAEMMDLQWICLRGVQDLGDTIHKNGDIIDGLAEQHVTGQQWRFTPGTIYLDGQHVHVDTGTVTLTGTGREVVGLQIVPEVVTHETDPYLRSPDEGVALQYAQWGAHRLVYTIAWVKDVAGQIDIREFLDGEPVTRVFATERTELQKELARRTFDVSGDFVVKNFPAKMRAHATDVTLLNCEISGGGKAYVRGNEVETIAPQLIAIPKGRDVKSRNNSVTEGFSIPGGSALGTGEEPFNVNGLSVKLKVGNGNYHTVNLTGTEETAAEVAGQINNSLNAYPTSGTLVNCIGVIGHLQIRANDGLSLVIAAVASDAYTELGLTTGTYNPTGQRIYGINDRFVRDTSDLSYITEIVEAVTHDGTDHSDPLANANVQDILGAADAEADAYDGKYDYVKLVDFAKTGDEIDFSGYGGAKPNNGATYYVRYRYNRNATKGVRVRVRVTDAPIAKGSEDGQDVLVHGGTAVEVISGNPVVGLAGNASDVIRILRVNDTAGQSQSEYDSYALLKNSTALAHAPSQIDWSAAGAQGVTPGGQPQTAGQYYCTYEFWQHTVEGDFCAPDSYLNDYDEIEYAPDGNTHLRDCIDFRTVNGVWPVAGESARLDYDFYLSRCDKIALQSTGYFQRIAGQPAEIAVPPTTPDGVLAVFQLTIPPYTYAPTDVIVQSLEIQRITQQGLNELKADLDRQKYYNAINLLASKATENPAASDAKGIFTDPLTGQNRTDVMFSKNGITQTAAIDPTHQVIRLPASQDGKSITVDDANSTGIARVGKVIVFDYQPSTFFSQLKASAIRNVNPHQLFGWIGTLGLDPAEDFWTDIETLPDVDVNYDNEMAALAQIQAQNEAARLYGISWGSWNLAWDSSGGWAEQTLGEAGGAAHWMTQSDLAWGDWGGPNAARQRSGSYKSLVPDRKLVDLGDRVVDMSVIPYLRTTKDGGPFYIGLTMDGLLPTTDIGCTIDGVAVDLLPTGSTVAGVATYQNKTTVATNGAGHATARFAVPSGIRVGQKAIKVLSATNPEESYAISTFTSKGFRETHQHQWQGLISTTERDEVVSQTEWHYGDPLAYTFIVESGTRWLSGVKLYVQAKDATLPLTVEIRETFNGSPTRKVLQSKTLYPASINISDDCSAATTFTFENLVGYGPGEYCAVVICNCVTYTVWYAKLGQTDVRTGELIRQNPAGGVLFESANDSYWQGFSDEDLCIEILEANFENNAQVVFDAISGINAGMLVAAVTQLLPQGCNLHWAYKLNNGAEWTPFVPGIDTELAAIATQIQLRADVTGSGGTFQISEDGAGIILLLNEPSADHISNNSIYEDPMRKLTIIAPMAVDGTNGTGTRTVTPYLSVDDGETWVEVKQPTDYVPVAIGDGTFRQYRFETPAEATVTGASETTPITISSASHGFQENAIVEITGVTGNTNANGIYRAVSVTDDTFDLVDPDTGQEIAGNGAYTGSGTFQMAEFTQMRYRFLLETSNQCVSPMIGEVMAFAA